jgi:Domain of unknown function (DUF4129)
MRSRELAACVIAVALACAQGALAQGALAQSALAQGALAQGAPAQGARARSPGAPAPSAQQVHEATEAVYADPDLHGLKADRELRFKDNEAPKEPQPGADLRWLRDLVRWFAEAGRWLMWLGMAAMAALLLLYLRRWLGVRGDALDGRALALPSHVRDLDIRPESLPDDLPGAVRALWRRGDSRAALSLLYRGALSRLVHDHGLPVSAASTEGECAALAVRHLEAERGAFVTRLIGLWQLAVYGARLPDGSAVLAVCDAFDAHLPRRAAAVAAATAKTAAA